MTVSPPDADDVEAAADRMGDGVVTTPCLRSETLARITGTAELWIKFENLQFSGSFKDRGALNRLLTLGPEARERGVIALSAGNHAQGVAYHAGRLGIPVTIVMPSTAPYVKVVRTRQLGAEVRQAGADLSACRELTDQLIAERGLTLVHPYDDPFIIAGQGTCGREIHEQAGELDDLIVPIGGGGLMSGIALALGDRRPGLRLVGVQTRRYAPVVRSLADDPPGPDEPGPTLADGIAVKEPGGLTLPIIAERVGRLLTVGETTIERSIALLLEIEKTVAEGAGAVPLAAILEHPEEFRDRRVGIVLSGGNIDNRLLATVLLRDLVRDERVTHLRIEADDLPGSLARVTGIISESGADVVEVAHQRLLTTLPARRVDIDVLVETRGADHTAELVNSLTDAGFLVRPRPE